jgi:hypothetical protein
MATTGSRIRKRVWRKIVAGLIVGVAVIGLFLFWKRFDIAASYMEGNKIAREMVILQMLEYAKPVIKSEFTMTFFEKLFSALANKRNEKERQADALKDVRDFCASCFEKHQLKFMNVHNMGTLNKYNLYGFDFALTWNPGKADEVLMAFNISFLKREIGTVQLNEHCSFFTDLRLYVEKKAKEN